MISRIIAVVAVLALLPVAASGPLRFFYQQWIAAQLAKVRRPSLVVIGDSLALRGGNYGRIDTINLASNGLQTWQIAPALERAKAYRPHLILANGGTNDVLSGRPVDTAQLHSLWHQICAEPAVVAALPTPTRSAEANAKLMPVRAVIRSECRRIIDVPQLAGPDGLLKPEYSFDGVHITLSTYRFWREALAKFEQTAR